MERREARLVQLAVAALLISACATGPAPDTAGYSTTREPRYTVDDETLETVQGGISASLEFDAPSAPSRVTYRPLEDSELTAFVQEFLDAGAAGDLSFFDGYSVLVGPFLTKELSAKQFFDRHAAIDAASMFKVGGRTVTVDQKLIWSFEEAACLAFFTVIRNEMIEDEEVSLRRANETELDWYWTLISWDIEEPVFVVENEQHSFLFDFGAMIDSMVYVDVIRTLDWEP